ncbi:MAG: D-alanyl-D-alanine carboxypeptidase family protein [Conchiformibius sp.]|nr:D-alanyl-D-alanine carboxypeptidase family protein [Conchiformibius sp.]
MTKSPLLILSLSAVLAAAAHAGKNQATVQAAASAASAPVAASAASAPANADKAPLPADAEPQIEASAYVVKDLQSNQIILSKNLNEAVEPASLTKLMTAYLTFKALEEGKLKPDQMLKVSEKAWKAEGSRMFLETRKPVSVSDLIKGLIVQSGNDAAITLAETLAGSEEQFAVQMNEQAKKLGMAHTRFENSTGLPGKEHLTTVNDLMLLASAIIRDYPQYYPIYSIKTFAYNGISQPNRNLLLYRDPSVDGLKTGHTASAGYNLIASSKRNGRRVVSVVVGASSEEARATESSKLLNYALQNFDTPKMYQSGQTISRIKVYKGAEKELPVGFLDNVYITLPHAQADQIKPVLETRQPVLAPIRKGSEMGTLKFMHGDKVLAEKKVVALADVSEAGFFGKLWDGIVLWFRNIFSD